MSIIDAFRWINNISDAMIIEMFCLKSQFFEGICVRSSIYDIRGPFIYVKILETFTLYPINAQNEENIDENIHSFFVKGYRVIKLLNYGNLFYFGVLKLHDSADQNTRQSIAACLLSHHLSRSHHRLSVNNDKTIMQSDDIVDRCDVFNADSLLIHESYHQASQIVR